MSTKNEDAIDYVLGTNGLEDISLSRDDIKRIMLDIQNGKKDSSFLYELVKELEKHKENKKQNEMGRAKI